METPVMYGIPNCDTIKKTTDWFKKNKIAFRFHDYKKEGITAARLKQWEAVAGWQTLLNTKGTTWRQLDEETKAAVKNAAAAIRLMTAHTSLIKRPVIETGGQLLVGFNEDQLKQTFKSTK